MKRNLLQLFITLSISFNCFVLPVNFSRTISESIEPLIKNNCSNSEYDLNNLYITHYSLFLNLFKRVPPAIEEAFDIKVANKTSSVLFINFEKDDGYLVLDSFNNVHEFMPYGDYSQIRLIDNLFYSLSDSFVVYDNDGCSYFRLFDDDKDDNNQFLSTSIYENVDGLIYDLDSYVSDVYPSFSFVEKKYLRNYTPIRQFDTSVYLKKHEYHLTSNTYFSEGNCVINSTYSLLCNLPTVETDSGYCYNYNSNFLNGAAPLNYNSLIQNDPFYYSYGVHNYYGTFYDSSRDDFYDLYWDTNAVQKLSIMPTLYLELREAAIECGYVTDGMLFNDTKTMVESVDSLYSYDLEVNLNSTIDTVISNINYGIPSLISTTNSLTFNNHSMAVYGYAKYSHQIIQFGVPITVYYYFWMVDSGWEDLNNSLFYDELGNRIDWFDPYRCDSVSFATLNRSTLTYPSSGGGNGGSSGGGGHGNLIIPILNP